MNFTAKEFIKLIPNVDLTPGRGHLDKNSSPIYAIHCIKQPRENVVITPVSGEKFTFPASAFVQGAIYPFSVKEINDTGANCFVGLGGTEFKL